MRFGIDIELDAPPDRVWEYISDISTHVDWMYDAASIDFVGDARQGVGTTFDCVTRIGPLRTTDRISITEWDPPSKMGVTHHGAVRGAGRFVLSDTGQGSTLFRWEETLSLL